MFIRREPRTKLSLQKPSFVGDIQLKQDVKEKRDLTHGPERVFCVGDRVYVKTVRRKLAYWEEGVVQQVVGAVTYVLELQGQLRFTYVDNLRSHYLDPNSALG